MAKKLDPRLLEILTTYGERPEDALWDCHGTWVAYHTAIERIAAKADIVFDMPMIVEANGPGKSVAICVKGKMGDNEDYREEWSFGEASAMNCKNSYFYAMAEKRAKDRVVLKLIGLHGLAYSEEESDDFRPKPDTTTGERQRPMAPMVETKYGEVDSSWQADGGRVSAASVIKAKTFEKDFKPELLECMSLVSLDRFASEWRKIAKAGKWPDGILSAARELIESQRAFIMSQMSPEALAEVPLDQALNASLKMHPINAG